MNRLRPYLRPALTGGVIAAAALWLLCFFIAGIDLFGGRFDLADTLYRMELATDEAYLFFGSRFWAAAYQVGTVFLLGAAVGISTAPFAEDGPTLLKRSLLHFILTGLLAVAAGWFVYPPYVVLCFYVTLYALIWLGRWVGWYMEVADLRTLLGLSPALSPLKWRETLPYLFFALTAGMAVPLLLSFIDAPDVPALTQLLYPYVLLPAACLCAGISLGRRSGFCPLFPLMCALCWLPTAALWLNVYPVFQLLLALIPALLGNLLGTWDRARKEA